VYQGKLATKLKNGHFLLIIGRTPQRNRKKYHTYKGKSATRNGGFTLDDEGIHGVPLGAALRTMTGKAIRKLEE
jgi:hypothetical protein